MSAADLAWLNRATWGASASSSAQLSRQGRERFLARQLDARTPATLPAAVQAQIDALRITRTPMDTLVMEMEQQRKAADAVADDEQKKQAQQTYQQELTRLAREASARMVLRAVYSPAQLREQMTWFWFNHFNVHQYKHNLRAMVGGYEEALRAHALGRFRDLLGASALHPAMLRYLDNEPTPPTASTKTTRASCWSCTRSVSMAAMRKPTCRSWRVCSPASASISPASRRSVRPQLQSLVVARGLVLFNPQRHDMGDKRVLGQQIKGRGFDEIDEVLDRLAQHPSTARFVSRKIAAYFVADQPPPALVERMAQRFLQSDGRIAEVLRLMFEAPEFQASLDAGQGKFKDPTHYLVSAVRLAYDREPIVNAQPIVNALYRMGQAPYNRQTPDGYPLNEAAWASPGQMAVRFDVARQIGSGNANLFRPDGAAPDPVQQKEAQARALPQLNRPQVQQSWQAALSPATRSALGRATTPQEWNAYFFAAPEFMVR